jgi:hypothetical protein
MKNKQLKTMSAGGAVAAASMTATATEVEATEHPRFDRCRFELTFDPEKDGQSVAYQMLSTQPRRLLQVLAKETARRKTSELVGDRLREVLEASRKELFPDTQQREIFRIFQDYRARFVRAGFLKVVETAA